ncbi:MAG: hypothetical protein NG740_01045 [Omnitrophica bacterium]|nr:hypothetical protein [Candidatus Omnitrophota bacterium]
MTELLRGNIKDGLGGKEFYEVEKGEYTILEKPKHSTQYLCSVWLSPGIYKFKSYIMVFEKTPGVIRQIAEWADITSPSQIESVFDKLVSYYSYETMQRIMVGVGRNTRGGNLINALAGNPRKQYDLYREKTRDASTGVMEPKAGIIDDDKNRIALIDDLQEAFSNNRIYPLPDSNVDVLKNIIVDKEKYTIPEKYEAYILSLAGAYRVFKEHPHRKPVDRTRIKALIQERRQRLNNPFRRST